MRLSRTKGDCVNTVDDGIVVRVCIVSSEKAAIHTHTHARALFLCFANTHTLSHMCVCVPNLQIFRALTIFFYIRFEIQSSSYHLLDRHEFLAIGAVCFTLCNNISSVLKRKSNFQHNIDIGSN